MWKAVFAENGSDFGRSVVALNSGRVAFGFVKKDDDTEPPVTVFRRWSGLGSITEELAMPDNASECEVEAVANGIVVANAIVDGAKRAVGLYWATGGQTWFDILRPYMNGVDLAADITTTEARAINKRQHVLLNYDWAPVPERRSLLVDVTPGASVPLVRYFAPYMDKVVMRGLNNNDDAVGAVRGRAALFRLGRPWRYIVGGSSVGWTINDEGVVAGRYGDGGGYGDGFVWAAGELTPIAGFRPEAINAAGVVVGHGRMPGMVLDPGASQQYAKRLDPVYAAEDADQDKSYWTDSALICVDNQVRDLTGECEGLPAGSWVGRAFDIRDDGTIAASISNGVTNRSAFLVPT